MSCGVSMERYDRGEQENLVLKNFGSKKFLAHPKSPKTQKIKNFQKTPKKMHIITKPKSVLVVNLSRLFHINITNIRSKNRI